MMERNDQEYWGKSMSFWSRTSRMGKMVSIGLLLLSLYSCVAQQADLLKLQKDFEAKVTKLDQEKKSLEQTLAEANKAIRESQKVLAQQKSEVSGLILARAQIKSELRSLREENLPQLSGELETGAHLVKQNQLQLQRFGHSMDDLTQAVKILEEDVNTRDQARTEGISTLRENVKKDFALQNKTMSENFAGLRASLVEFKKALAGIDRRLAAEQIRAVAAETNIVNDLEAQQAALLLKLDSEAKLLSDLNVKVGTELAVLGQQDEGTHQNVENLVKSIVQLKSGLAKIGEQLGSKIDEHAQSLEKSDGRLKQVESQIAALSKKLKSDTEVLRGYLDKEIRVNLELLAKAVEVEKTRQLESSKKLEGLVQTMGEVTQSDLKQTKAQMAAQDQYVKDLNQSVASTREVLDSIAGLLGKRSDDQMQQVGKLLADLSRQDTNVQILSKHLQEVTGSVQSIVKSLDQVKTALTSRLDQQNVRLGEQEQRLIETANRSVSSKDVNQELKANVQYVNELKESLRQLQNVVRDISSRLGGKVDEHAEKVNKELASNVRYMNQLRESLRSTMDVIKKQESQIAVLKQQMKKSKEQENQIAVLKQQMKQSSATLNNLLKRLKPLLRAPGFK